MTGDITIDQDTLVVDGERIRFDDQIAEFLEWGQDLIVVRFKAPAESDCDRNIRGIGQEGSEKWVVQEPTVPPAHESNPFISIYEQDGGIWGHCYWGPAYRIDPETGELLDREDVK
jgi:hypothetical protein